VSLKNRGIFENPQLLTGELLRELATRGIRTRAKRATLENLWARRRKFNHPSAIIP
jgi:hypothetical protein